MIPKACTTDIFSEWTIQADIKMTTSVQKVFGIVELFEEIMNNVDDKALFHAKLVSRDFHELISSNSNYQQRLFQKPQDSIHALIVENGTELLPELVMNRLLLPSSEKEYGPLLDYFQNEPLRWAALNFDPRLASPTIPRDSSCRDMLLMQPALTQIQVWLIYQSPKKIDRKSLGINDKHFKPRRRGWYRIVRTLQNSKGVRFGDILDWLEQRGFEGTMKTAELAMYLDSTRRRRIMEEGKSPPSVESWREAWRRDAERESDAAGQQKLIVVDAMDARLVLPFVNVTLVQKGWR